MWRKSLVLGTALSMAVFAAGARADHDRRERGYRGDDVDYARVLDVEPIVRFEDGVHRGACCSTMSRWTVCGRPIWHCRTKRQPLKTG